MSDDVLAGARALLPGAELEDAGPLRGGERSEVRRVVARRPGEPDRSVIVKRYLSADEGWARESAALTVLPHGAPVPTLLAASPEPPIVIMSDVGWGASVADALLGSYPGVARDAVSRWATAIAELHRVSLGLRGPFTRALDERSGELPISAHLIPVGLEDAARAIADQAAELGIPAPAAALEQLRGLSHRLNGERRAALSPADACPDNNVGTDVGLVLVDFEGAQWRHIAWDVAYLRVPWPSCWCSWRMPDEVADAAVTRYQQRLVDELPYVGTDEFERDVAAAATGWALMSTTWFLSSARGDDAPGNPDKPTPTRRAMILHRLAGAARCGELTALADFAGALRGALVQRWGEAPLAYAPAFAGRAQ